MRKLEIVDHGTMLSDYFGGTSGVMRDYFSYKRIFIDRYYVYILRTGAEICQGKY